MTNDPMLLPILKFLLAMLLFSVVLDRLLTEIDWRIRERRIWRNVKNRIEAEDRVRGYR